MKKKDLAELAITRAIETEALRRVVETGEVQLRRTFDMYLELLDKVNGHGRERNEQQTGVEANI